MSVAYPHPLIAKEGWPFLAIAVAAAAAAGWFAGWWWSAPLWVAALFVLQFFRDPPREVPADPRAVVSPADGRIVVVGKARDPYRDCDALKISVFMNVFNVHSNRSPVDGIVGKVEYHAGSFFNAALDKASLENERNALLMLCGRRCGPPPGPALRVHPVRFPGRPVPSARRRAACGHWGQGLRFGNCACEAGRSWLTCRR